jgi:hypothetical protein
LGRGLLLTIMAAIAAIALPALVLPLAGPAQAARVIFLEVPDLSTLPDGVTIDRWNGRQAILAGVDAGAARALYASGALIVYPVRRAGCLSLSQT